MKALLTIAVALLTTNAYAEVITAEASQSPHFEVDHHSITTDDLKLIVSGIEAGHWPLYHMMDGEVQSLISTLNQTVLQSEKSSPKGIAINADQLQNISESLKTNGLYGPEEAKIAAAYAVTPADKMTGMAGTGWAISTAFLNKCRAAGAISNNNSQVFVNYDFRDNNNLFVKGTHYPKDHWVNNSVTAVISPSGKVLAAQLHESVLRGETYEDSFSWTKPADAEPGKYEIVVCDQDTRGTYSGEAITFEIAPPPTAYKSVSSKHSNSSVASK